MPDFKTVIEDFSSTMDALRDFASSVGPVLLQRQDQVSKVVYEKIAPFAIARMLAGETSDTELSDDTKQAIDKVRELFTGTELKVSPERATRAREEILKILPLKVVEGKIEIDFHHPNTNEIFAQHRALDKVNREVGLLYESSVMVLASRSEWLIAQLMHIYFGKYPGAAGISEPFFSLEKLATLETIEDARNVLIENRVEVLMRQSFGEWVHFFKEKVKLGTAYLDASTPQIVEIFKRRNLVVHNGGRVSRYYLEQIDQQLSVGLKVGDTVTITPEYLNSSIDVIEHQFVLIAAELWKKLEPEDSERCPLLLNLGVRCLEESRWTTARGFSYFVMNDGNETEANRLKGRINYWQSFKWPGEYESIRDEVEKYDFSAKGEIFQIACAAVKSDFDALFKLLPRAIESGALSKSNLWSWPLFRELRAQARFAAYAPDSEPGPPASPASPPSDQTQTT